jgi:hypothetical protein
MIRLMTNRYARTMLWALALLVMVAPVGPAQAAHRNTHHRGKRLRARPNNAALPQKILQFGRAHLGKPTADPGLGFYCANFVAAALHAAGARSTENFGVSGANPNLDFVWGKLVVKHTAGRPDSDFKLAQPGDVLQFRHAQGPKSNGMFEQHTAIVEKNLGGGRFVVLEQNYNNQKFVTRDTIDMSRMTSGTVWIYRAVPK